MIIKDDVILQLERRSQRLLYLILIIFVLLSALFLHFAGSFVTNPIKLRKTIRNTIQLKLSSSDLLALSESNAPGNWVDVRLVDRENDEFSVKIRHAEAYTFNFQIRLRDTIYNLYEVGQFGKEMYDFFKTAKKWGLKTSSPELVQLKINNVLIGIYVLEEHIYEQIRDEKGQYFIRFNSNIRLLNRIFHQVEISEKTGEHPQLLEQWFDTGEMASYLVFFSLFSFDEVLSFDWLVFRFDPQENKFRPYLTLESVILSLREQGRTFKLFPVENPAYSKRMNRLNTTSLLIRRNSYKEKYDQLLRCVLGQVNFISKIASISERTRL